MAPLVAGGLTPRARLAIRGVLVFEIVVNVAQCAVSLVSPQLALQPMSVLNLSSGTAEIQVGLEAQRWFAVMGGIFGGFLLWRVLDTPRALHPLLEALCLGDILYLLALLPFATQLGKLPGILAPFLLTAVMFAARATLLTMEDWDAACAAHESGNGGHDDLGADEPAAPARAAPGDTAELLLEAESPSSLGSSVPSAAAAASVATSAGAAAAPVRRRSLSSSKGASA